MRLHRHDELLEAMVEAARRQDGYRNSIRAALDALLEAAVRLGVGKMGNGVTIEGDWHCDTIERDGIVIRDPEDFPALILRMEASDDNA